MARSEYKLLRCENAEEASIKVADAIAVEVKEIIERKGRAVIALPGGRSVLGIYSRFSVSREPFWRNAHFFLLDERVVPMDSAESNYRLLRDSFLAKMESCGIVRAENMHPFAADESANDFGASEYYSALEEFGGNFDIALLSAGEDCHIASLFPGNSVAGKRGKNYFFVPDSPKPPAHRITASAELVGSAESAFLLFMGEYKRSAYEKFLGAETSAEKCPAKFALGAKELAVVTDLR